MSRVELVYDLASQYPDKAAELSHIWQDWAANNKVF